MGSPVTRMVRRSVRAGQKLVSQIVVSVAAAVCVGVITNAYLERPASPEPAATPVVTEAAANVVTDTPIRIIEGASNTSVRSGAPARPLEPVAEPAVRNVADAPMPAPAAAPTEVASLPPLPSEIVADLPVADINSTPEGAEIFPGVPAESTLADSLRDPPASEEKPERRRFLGLPLPYVMPAANAIAHSVGAAGNKLVALVER